MNVSERDTARSLMQAVQFERDGHEYVSCQLYTAAEAAFRAASQNYEAAGDAGGRESSILGDVRSMWRNKAVEMAILAAECYRLRRVSGEEEEADGEG